MSSSAEDPQQYVIFRVERTEYALPIRIVQEVIRFIAPAPTGSSSRDGQGVIDLRGRVVPVRDLAIRLGSAGRSGDIDPKSKIVIVDIEDNWQGLIVDSVDEVLTIAREHLHPAPAEHGSTLSCIANFEGRIVMILDAYKLLGVSASIAA